MPEPISSPAAGPWTRPGVRPHAVPVLLTRALLVSALVSSWLLPLLGGSPAAADILVTQDGQRIETDGPWEVKGRQVVFTTKTGVLSALRLTEVDLEASERATNPPPSEAPAATSAQTGTPSLVDLAGRDRPAPVMVLTNDDIGSASSKELEALARIFGGAMMEVLRDAGDRLAEEGEISEAEKASFDREMAEKQRLIQQGYEEVLLSLASLAKRYPELQELEPSSAQSVREHAVTISQAARELRVSALQIQTVPGRVMLNMVADQFEALVAGIP